MTLQNVGHNHMDEYRKRTGWALLKGLCDQATNRGEYIDIRRTGKNLDFVT